MASASPTEGGVIADAPPCISPILPCTDKGQCNLLKGQVRGGEGGEEVGGDVLGWVGGGREERRRWDQDPTLCQILTLLGGQEGAAHLLRLVLSLEIVQV